MDLAGSNVIFTTETPKQINETFNGVVKDGGSFEDLKAALSEYEKYSPLYVKFLFAKFQSFKRNFSEASDLITEVIQGLDSVVDYTIGFNQQTFAPIYGLAGEIYANNNQFTESQIAYQDYQLCLCRLKGLEQNDSLLSFRKYNE